MIATNQPKCILVTGPGHSATRMLVQLFNEHPDVSVPMESLNYVCEFTPAHMFFVRSMDLTPLHSPEYAIDFDELRFIMDAYMLNVDRSKPYCLFKMPYYVLNCMDFFLDYFQGGLLPLYSCRPAEKIVKSFINRGEDKLFFHDDMQEISRQIKKLPVSERKAHLAAGNASEFFRAMVEQCNRLRDDWNTRKPDCAFTNVDVEQLATSSDYLRGLLDSVGINTDSLEQLTSIVNSERLLHHRSRRSGRGILRRLAKLVSN